MPGPRLSFVRTPYPVLVEALERHLGWASEFAEAGDLESAVDAIRDAQAAFAELHAGALENQPR